MKIRRIAALVCAILLLASCPFSAYAASTRTTYSKSGTGRTALQITEKVGSLGMRLKVRGAVRSVGINMPTWSVSGKYSADISVYEWKETFAKTVAEKPVRTQKYTKLRDCALNVLGFDPLLPAGEYLFLVENTVGTVGCWAYDSSGTSKGYTYVDGAEVKKELEMEVTFESGMTDPFGQVESVSALYGKAPAYEPVTADQTDLSGYGLPETSLYLKNDVMPDTWVFTDEVGRRALTNADVGDPRDDKTLALFYWTWHVSQGKAKPFNVQQFLDEEEAKGTDLSGIINDYSYSGWPKGGVQNFWDEPIYGYYKTNDEWVLRRQSEMLANALVDTVFTDCTNGTFTWKDSYVPLFETWTKAQKDGVQTPKVSFMLPFGPNENTRTQLKLLYLDVFRDGKYQSLWFRFGGKPMMMAHYSHLSLTDPLEKEIRSFFTFRPNIPEYINTNPTLKTWGWLSTYPQAVYYASAADKAAGKAEQITVGVAMNHNSKTHQLDAMNGKNIMDRTYTSNGYDTRENALLLGANFEEQWNYALKVDPKVVFVTGWNEWIAGRFDVWCGTKNAFPDEFNDRASRDLEPSRGALRDHYYYQFVNFVRQYKGVRPIPTPTGRKTVDIRGDLSQWSDVGPYYAAYIGSTGDRDADGYSGTHYADFSGRNDIIGAQIARDKENLYILVECAEEITPYTDPLWMNVYLDTDPGNGGWNTFDYVINKTSPKDAQTAYLERFTGNGYGTDGKTEVSYSVSGRYLQIAVPKSALGLKGDDFTVNFAVTDNVHDESDKGEKKDGKTVYSTFSGDLLDFYTSGDVAPGGRFKYSYISTAENAGADTETGAAGTETGAKTGGKGCGSVLGCGTLLASLAAAAAARKKKKRP